MSLLQTALVAKSSVPDRVKLEAAVRALGFDLRIDECYRPFECSGFLPCVLKGKKSGFEIYFGAPEETLENFPHLREQVGTRDCAITFRWGGDMSECACVLIVSAALAKSFDAVVHYQDDDLVYSPDQLIEEANQALGLSQGGRNFGPGLTCATSEEALVETVVMKWEPNPPVAENPAAAFASQTKRQLRGVLARGVAPRHAP